MKFFASSSMETGSRNFFRKLLPSGARVIKGRVFETLSNLTYPNAFYSGYSTGIYSNSGIPNYNTMEINFNFLILYYLGINFNS